MQERKVRDSKTPEIHLQFIVMKHNQGSIDAAISMAEEFGVDFIDFKSMILSGGSGLNAGEKISLPVIFFLTNVNICVMKEITGIGR